MFGRVTLSSSEKTKRASTGCIGKPLMVLKRRKQGGSRGIEVFIYSLQAVYRSLSIYRPTESTAEVYPQSLRDSHKGRSIDEENKCV